MSDLDYEVNKLNMLFWAIRNGASWQDDGAKERYDGARKSMNGAYLPVFFIKSQWD